VPLSQQTLAGVAACSVPPLLIALAGPLTAEHRSPESCSRSVAASPECEEANELDKLASLARALVAGEAWRMVEDGQEKEKPM